MIGRPYGFKYINDNEFLLSTNRGVISKINNSGEVQWKRNMIYKSEIDLDNSGQCKFIFKLRFLIDKQRNRKYGFDK
jgi:hypothetical protein